MYKLDFIIARLNTSACPPAERVFLHFSHLRQGRCQSLPSEDTLSAEIGINSKIMHNLHGFLWLFLEKITFFSHQLTLVKVCKGQQFWISFNGNLALVANIAKLVRLYTDFISTSM